MLDKCVVPGEREGNALANTQQPQREEGDFGGRLRHDRQNIGNILQRLSGVSMSEQKGSMLFIKGERHLQPDP